jgi:transcriptional regulator with GAF, ATPase, and Fis domain
MYKESVVDYRVNTGNEGSKFETYDEKEQQFVLTAHVIERYAERVFLFENLDCVHGLINYLRKKMNFDDMPMNIILMDLENEKMKAMVVKYICHCLQEDKFKNKIKEDLKKSIQRSKPISFQGQTRLYDDSQKVLYNLTGKRLTTCYCVPRKILKNVIWMG